MAFKRLSADVSASPQLTLEAIDALPEQGFRAVINNRPDGEEPGQPTSREVEARARAAGLDYAFVPVAGGQPPSDEATAAMAQALAALPKPILAFCRSGARSELVWRGAQAAGEPKAAVPSSPRGKVHDVVVVGGGAGGLATAASLLRRDRSLDVVVVEPRDTHDYQPGWTMVGAGVFTAQETRRPEARVMPKGVTWIRASVASFQPEHDQVTLADGGTLRYRALVVAPGIKLDWDAVPGLRESLGRFGVTSNYSYETAPYTWKVVQALREGVALFTQPPMPIKCAGAPQKAMYLSCDHWLKAGRLNNIDVAFHNANAALFGVAAFVPPLMTYVERYGVTLKPESRLTAIDGPARRATFAEAGGEVTRSFDMIHVCPPQRAPEVVAESPLANAAGYVDVDQATLRHVRYPNVYALGDAGSTPNAKTAAAARKQAPIVASNLLSTLKGGAPVAAYDGYGSCPLTVERGRILLAEFGYGGKLLPTFPKWLIDGQKPQRLSWLLKDRALPFVYWNGMLKGREWLAAPHPVDGSRAN